MSLADEYRPWPPHSPTTRNALSSLSFRSPIIEQIPDNVGFVVRLSDGRRIGCAAYGDPDGVPLLWHPGTPGSRLAAPPDEDLTRSRGVRFIAIERPGFGRSDPKPKRRILDWPDDLAQVADALGLDRFAIAGNSGAGPYLAACALRLRHRVTRVGMIGVVGPVAEPEVRRGLSARRRAMFGIARLAPWLLERNCARFRGNGEAFYREIVRDAPACDRRIVERIWARQVRMTSEAIRQGCNGFSWELHLASRPWGFSLADITAEVHLWQGEHDPATPVAMGRYLATTIPGCRATFIPDAGHLLHFERWDEILDRFVPKSDSR